MEYVNDFLQEKRVVAYVRVSTEEQKLHGISIDAQTNALQSWANERGVKIMKFYNDAGFSARKPYNKRPAMVQLMEDVQTKKIDLIIFTKLDRWFRSLQDYFKVQEILEKSNVYWRTIHEDYDTSTASGRLKINIMLSVAQDEADRTSERIKAVYEMKRQKLEPLTGQMPFGYIIREKKIVKDPKTEVAVNIFFSTLLASGSVSAAQRAVSERCGITINYLKAHRMMESQAYIGKYFGMEGMTPPYLTEEEFKRVQGMKRKVVRKSPKNNIFLFSGLAICPVCGRRMGTRRSTKANYQYYTCPSPYNKDRPCENRTCFSEKKIEAYLLERIEEKMKQLRVDFDEKKAQRQGAEQKKEIATLRRKILKLKELFLNDLITIEEYKRDKAEYEEKLGSLLAQEDPKEEDNLVAIETTLAAGWKDIYAGVGKEGQREFWRSTMREIRLYPDRHIEFDLNV